MKITEDVRTYAAKQGIAGEEALKQGMAAKSREFVEKGHRGLREGVTPGARLCEPQQRPSFKPP